jgi:hypothetical protein
MTLQQAEGRLPSTVRSGRDALNLVLRQELERSPPTSSCWERRSGTPARPG